MLVLPQIASQVLEIDPASIRCKPRAWKVHLVGEGADDAGGVFDETIAQMCEVRTNIIPSPLSLLLLHLYYRKWREVKLIYCYQLQMDSKRLDSIKTGRHSLFVLNNMLLLMVHCLRICKE